MSGIALPNGTFWWTHRPHSDACEQKEALRKLALSDPNTPRERQPCAPECRHGEAWPTLCLLQNPQEKKASLPPPRGAARGDRGDVV
jgi:hypothetical protein